MNSVNWEEVDAKIAVVEARLEGHVAAIRASIDGLLMRMDERDKRTDERFSRIEQLYEKTQAAIGDLKKTTIVTGVSAVIAIVLGVGAINATVFSNMIAAFQAGSNMGLTQAEVKRQVEETAVLLKQLQAAQGKPAQPSEPASNPSPHQP